MKKLIGLLVCIMVFMSSIILGYADGNISVKLNGEEITFDNSPIIVNNRLLVPMRKIFETLGASVNWDSGSQTVSANKDYNNVVIKIDSYSATINGSEYTLDVAAQLINGITFVPLRFVSNALDVDVNYDSNQNEVLLVQCNPIDFAAIHKTSSVGDYIETEIVKNSIGTPELHLVANNNTKKDITAFEFECQFKDGFGRPVCKTGTTDSIYKGIVQDGILKHRNWNVPVGQDDNYSVSIFNLTLYDLADNVDSTEIKITKIKFSDGTEWNKN